jgi:hypothetical protein
MRTRKTYRKVIVGQLILICKWLLKLTSLEQGGKAAIHAVNDNVRCLCHRAENYTAR